MQVRSQPGRTQFVGRAAELAELVSIVDGPPAPGFRFVQIAGEPGIGKSRLLAELAAAARDKGQEVLAGRASEFESDRPFGVFADALDDHFAALGPAWYERLGAVAVARCAAVFPAFGVAAEDVGDHLGAERHVLHRAVRAALEAVVGRAGLVVVLDDLHWADVASLELLDHLVRRPGRGRLTFVVAHRPRQLSVAGHTVLARAMSDGRGHRLELGPLSEEATAELLGPDTGRARAAGLHRASRGNPFYLQALAASADPAVWQHNPAELTEELPAHVRAALLSEVDRLTPVTRLVVRAAAVAGEPVDAELVAVTAVLPVVQVRAALDEALAADIFRGGTGTRAVEFRHPLLRHLVYDAAPLSWRDGAHRRLAEVLARRGAVPEDLARHLELTARPGDTAAVRVLVEAANRVRFRAPATAARWLAAALGMVPASAVEDRLALQLELACTLTAAGRTEEGVEVLRRLIRGRPPGGSSAHTRAVVLWSTVERWLGRFQALAPVLRAELATIDESDPVTAATLHHELAYVEHALGNQEVAEQHALAVTRTPPVPQVRGLRASASGLLAYNRFRARDIPAAAGLLDEATAGFEQLTDDELSQHLLAVEHSHWAGLFLGRYQDALRLAKRVLAVAGTGHHLAVLRSQLRAATALYMLGELAEAEQFAEEAIEVATLVDQPLELALSLLLTSEVAVDRGDLDRAVRLAEDVVEIARKHELRSIGPAVFQLAEARRVAGRPVDLVADFPELGYDHPSRRVWELPSFQLEQLIAHAVALGEFDYAEQALAHCRMLAHELVRGSIGHAKLSEALLSLGRKDVAAAAELARAAMAAFAADGMPLNVGKAQLTLGSALAELGERAQALAELDRAIVLFTECGAHRWVEQAVKLQRKQGRRVAKSAPRVSPGELTVRETEIAELVSQGLSNKAIAERLVLSERTVTTHVSNILAKTGLPSRTALAAQVLRAANEE
ncbi:AAA family ATPase [Crossiella sp. NPDC003009]